MFGVYMTNDEPCDRIQIEEIQIYIKNVTLAQRIEIYRSTGDLSGGSTGVLRKTNETAGNTLTPNAVQRYNYSAPAVADSLAHFYIDELWPIVYRPVSPGGRFVIKDNQSLNIVNRSPGMGTAQIYGTVIWSYMFG